MKLIILPLALKIHISNEFKAILSILGGYNVVERGETLLKVCVTFT